MTGPLGRREIRDELKLGGPRRQEDTGFAIELGGVRANDDPFGLGQERFLEGGYLGFTGPDTAPAKPLRAEKE